MFLDVFGLYFRALFGDEKSTSACIFGKLLWVTTFEFAGFEILLVSREFLFD